MTTMMTMVMTTAKMRRTKVMNMFSSHRGPFSPKRQFNISKDSWAWPWKDVFASRLISSLEYDDYRPHAAFIDLTEKPWKRTKI
jgi:hypothetical protein